jgi:serine/threonine-protein kinase
MMGDHGEVLVVDWGLARPIAGTPAASLFATHADAHSDEPSGTPLYMSPEQAKGAPLDERSDVYTLGVMLYELASLEHPYRASSLAALLAQIITGEVRPFEEVLPDSPSLAAIVRRAMALEPGERYQSVAAFRDDLERFLDGLTPQAEDAGFVRRARGCT